MLITNFASGELSPRLNGRVDLQQYYQAASRIENFEIIPTGGIRKRSGTKRMAKLEKNSRIIPFILDKNNVFIFQAYAYTLKIWKLGTDGNMYEMQVITFQLPAEQPNEKNFWENTWYYKVDDKEYVKASIWEEDRTYYLNYFDFMSLADINEIQYCQNYNTFIMTSRKHIPVMIEYNSIGRSFKCSYMHFDFKPNVELDDDFDFIMLPVGELPECTKTPAANGYYEFTYYRIVDKDKTEPVTKSFTEGINDVYCVFNNHLYKYEMGTSWQLVGDDPDEELLFSSEGNYPGCCAFFNNRLFFASTIRQQQKIWAAGIINKNEPYNDFSTYTKYITVNKVVKDADLHIFTCDISKSDVDYIMHRTVLRKVSQDLTNQLSKDAELYFVSGDGVPSGTRVEEVTENTITIGTDKISIPDEGLTNQVFTIQLWHNASTPDGSDYEYAVVNNNITRADNSFNFEIASDENDAIMFLSSNRFLAIGTESSIWSVAAGCSALEVNAVMQGRYGSDNIQGQTVATATIYFAQGRKGIREFYFDSQSEAFQTNNIAIMAEQMLTESAAVDFDYMTNPYNRIMITRYAGDIVSLLYDKNNGVMGWNRISRTAGLIKDIAVTRGPDESDLVFMVVQDGQDQDGNDLFYLELMDPGYQVFLDSWDEYDGSTEGYTDEAYLYNATQDKLTYASSVPADFIAEGDQVYIGYLIRSYIKSMPVLNNDPTGKKRISSLLIRFLESNMPVLKVTGLPDELFYDVETPYSGIKEITYPGQSERDVYFEIEGVEPKDVCILSVNANIV